MLSPLLTDLYQLTMAYGYWKLNMHEREAVFQLFFRNSPFKGQYVLACGLETVIDFIQQWHFSAEDLLYLGSLKTVSGEALFSAEFLHYLADLRLVCHLDAMPEGTLAFPHQPLLRVTGPLLQCQLLESSLLNIVNFQSLIATKASRICQAAAGDDVLEFGMRRAQGPDGALSASRASYIGGCAATSHVLAGKQFGIPVRGTHAHSWVTTFADEASAFAAYAEVMPQNCILLVDTYDTLGGIRQAIEIGKKLQEKGSKLLGIRLDSGDLAALSKLARQLLDEAGLQATTIVASNNLDEHAIRQLKQEGAPITVWGVGTSLVTAYDQPALDGVYKLSAIRNEEGKWEYKCKLSEQGLKASDPGIYQVRRYYAKQQMQLDVLYDIEQGISDKPQVKLADAIILADFDAQQDLLQPIFRAGQLVYHVPTIHQAKALAMTEVNKFMRLYAQQIYPLGHEKNSYDLKLRLMVDLANKNVK